MYKWNGHNYELALYNDTIINFPCTVKLIIFYIAMNKQ